MEKALGGPLKLNQDAINAAYLSVGWKRGEEPRTELDAAAFRHAWRWGFRIEDLTRAGRQERFSLDALAAGPVRWGDVSRSEPAAFPQPAKKRGLLAKREPVTLEASTISAAPDTEPAENHAEDEARIAHLEGRLKAAQQAVAEIERQIAGLETDSSAAASETRSTELQAQIATLRRSLDESSRTVSSVEAELASLTRDLSAN